MIINVSSGTVFLESGLNLNSNIALLMLFSEFLLNYILLNSTKMNQRN